MSKKININDRRLFSFKVFTVFLAFLMGLWGVLGIYNATVFSGDPFYFAGKQLIWLLLGLFILLISAHVPFRFYKNNVFKLSFIAYIALFSVLFLGVKVNGMKGWFDLYLFYIQPSEIAKPIFILSLCCITAWKEKKQLSEHLFFFILFAVTALWCLPIVLEPDFGTLLIYITGFFIVYFLSGGKFIYFAMLFGFMLLGAVTVYFMEPYVAARINSFLNPAQDPLGAAWHLRQLQYTMARGGFSGQNWGESLWANVYLPLPYSDSVFAALVEAVGFIGTFPVVLAFAALVFAGVNLSKGIISILRRNFILGMTSLISVQAFLHMSVNVTMLPATGITLPLFSYGSSSMIATMLSLGIALSAVRDNSNEESLSELCPIPDE